MKMTIGYDAALGLGESIVVDIEDGTPIKIEGLDMQVSVVRGALVLRTNGQSLPTVRPESGNVIAVTAEPRT